jgi:hypothetical protein
MVMVAPTPRRTPACVVGTADMDANADAADMGSNADSGIRRCCAHQSRRKNRNDQFLHGRVLGCVKRVYFSKRTYA